jgi:hypothetical protein
MNGMPRSQCLFNKVAAFDDRSEVSAVALKQVEIRHGSPSTINRLAKARGTISPILPDDLGIDERRRPDDFLRTHNVRANEKLAAVIVLKLSQEVTAKADLDACGAREFKRPKAGFEYDRILIQAVR